MVEDRPGEVHFNVFDVGSWLGWLFEHMAKPVTSTLGLLMKSGFIGFTVAFALVFSLLLVRYAAGTKNVEVYGALLHRIGRWGMFGLGCYLALLCVEFILMPPLTVFVSAFGNTLAGHKPGVGDVIGMLFSGGVTHDGVSERDLFFRDLGAFYGHHKLLLPLGFNSVILLLVAFGVMFAVGEAIRHIVHAKNRIMP